MRVPTVKSGSLASSTVAVSGPTVVTRPTSPSPLRTVMSRLMPSLRAGVDGDGPGEALGRSYGDDLGALDAVLAGAGGLQHLVELARAGCGCGRRCRASAFSARVLRAPARRSGRAARRSRVRRRWRCRPGRRAADTPFSTGPKTVAAACRAPSTGDSSPAADVHRDQCERDGDQQHQEQPALSCVPHVRRPCLPRRNVDDCVSAFRSTGSGHALLDSRRSAVRTVRRTSGGTRTADR